MGKSESERGGHRRVPMMLWLVFGLLLMNVSIVGVTFYLANSDGGFAVEPDYYGKAVRWDIGAAERDRALNRGWTMAVEPNDARSASGGRTLTIRLLDRDGGAIGGATLGIEAFQHKDASKRFVGSCLERGPGVYQVDVPLVGAGLHEVRATIEYGSETLSLSSTSQWPEVR